LLKILCAYITSHYDAAHIIIAANKGGSIGLAAGHYLATSQIPVVYMQNSSEGNIINLKVSLTDSGVYNISVLLLIG
jgi:phosphonopyruvate decarboxylase